ncbi:MAG: putrescine ABC transporter permease PotH, partial [Pseudomonadota bacterium]
MNDGAERWWRRAVVLAPLLWLTCFFVLPFLVLLKIALAQAALAMPPFTPLIDASGDGPRLQATLENFRFLLEDSLYLSAYLNSLSMASLTTVLCLAVGFPLALGIARCPARWRGPLLLALMLPFWTSFLLRVYAWMGLLAGEGPINQLLRAVGLRDAPLAVLYTDTALLLGMTYTYLPFMVLPLFANLDRHDVRVREAAADLGAKAWERLMRVTLPLAVPGMLSGAMLVFIPAAGEFVIPTLLGGPE